MAEWIRTRVPAPPAALSQRLSEILGDEMAPSTALLPESLINRAAELIAHIENDRAAATDLLSADALITYAMEAAAEYSLDVEAIGERAALTLAMTSSRGGQP